MTDTNQLREAFEVRMTDGGKWPAAVERGRGGAYRLAQTENAWTEWQACAESLQAIAQVQGEAATVAVDHFDNAPHTNLTSRIHPPVEIGAKLYTTPQPAQATQAEVTDEQILTAAARHLGELHVENCGIGDLKEFARAALSQQPTTGEPVQADSSGHLRVIASLGAALRRLSFAAQTTGGTDGPDAELQSAIGQAEQALSLGGIGQAMSATGEPVKAAPYNPTEEMRWAMKRIDPALSSEQCRALWSAAWSASQSTHPAPCVPDAVARDAERYRFILAAADDMTTSRYKSLCELLGVAITEDFNLGAAIDAAMLAAKERP